MDILPSILSSGDEVAIRKYILENRDLLVAGRDPCVLDGGLAHVLVSAQAYPTLYFIRSESHRDMFREVFGIKDRLGRTAGEVAALEGDSIATLMLMQVTE